MVNRTLEDVLEHLSGKPTGIRVLPRAVIAREQHSPIRRYSFGAVSELGIPGFQPQRPCCRTMCDFAKRHDDRDFRQRSKRRLEVIAAVCNFLGQRSVAWWQAFDRIEDDCSKESHVIIGFALVGAAREFELEQGRIEHLARIIAGERAASSIGSAPPGSETQNCQPRVRIAECRHRRVPPVRVLGAELLAQAHQAGAPWTIMWCFCLRDRRQVGGSGHLLGLARSASAMQSTQSGRLPRFARTDRGCWVSHLYAIAIGSNRPHGRYGRPPQIVEAAVAALDREFGLFDASPIILNGAIGGAGRDFANAVALVESDLEPFELLHSLKAIERKFGRRRGKHWSARVLDLDIILWSGGSFRSRSLTIPHYGIQDRSFVLQPLAAIAPSWRVRGALTVRHLAHRLARRAPQG